MNRFNASVATSSFDQPVKVNTPIRPSFLKVIVLVIPLLFENFFCLAFVYSYRNRIKTVSIVYRKINRCNYSVANIVTASSDQPVKLFDNYE